MIKDRYVFISGANTRLQINKRKTTCVYLDIRLYFTIILNLHVQKCAQNLQNHHYFQDSNYTARLRFLLVLSEAFANSPGTLYCSTLELDVSF